MTPKPPFQQRVWPWLVECFGHKIALDQTERTHRFVEESLELAQSLDCTASEAHQLVDYVFSRPIGERKQEAGGVMVTLAALCAASFIDMHECGEDELSRVWGKIEQIRAKQAAKPKHSPLPVEPTPQGSDTPEPNIWRRDGYHGDNFLDQTPETDAQRGRDPNDVIMPDHWSWLHIDRAHKIEKSRNALAARVKELEAYGDPCSLADAAAKPEDSLSLIHHYDAAACCALLRELRVTVTELEAERDALIPLAYETRPGMALPPVTWQACYNEATAKLYGAQEALTASRQQTLMDTECIERLQNEALKMQAERDGYAHQCDAFSNLLLNIGDTLRVRQFGNGAMDERVIALAQGYDAALDTVEQLRKDKEIVDWLEAQVRPSRTGISFDWIPACEGEPSGYRYMRHHRIDEPKKTIRESIRAAMSHDGKGQE